MDKEKSGKDLSETTTVPVMEEELRVEKRTVETGITTVTKKVHHVEESVEAPLLKEEVEVERVAVNRIVDRPEETRTEGDVTIIPVLEEIIVVEKKLLLKEEIRIRRRRTSVTHREKEVVRREEAVVEHRDITH